MADLFRFVMVGLGNGAIYAMVALGLVVMYRASGLLSFAHGELSMVATFVVWTLHDWGVPLWVAMALGAGFGFGFGAIVQRVVVAPVGNPHERQLPVVIATIGLLLGLNALAQVVWGTTTRSMPALFGHGSIDLFGVAIAWQKVGALLVLAVEVAVLFGLFQRTKLGLAMRAVASNPDNAALCGVPVGRVLMLSWGFAVALGAVAGTFAAPDRGMDSNLMLLVVVYAFAAMTVGGFDSLVGAVVGGLLVGVVSEVVPKYVDPVANLPLVPVFVLLVVVLVLRPQGLFGRAKVSRV